MSRAAGRPVTSGIFRAATAMLLSLVACLALAVAPAAAAGGITFAAPTATATFGTGITFQQPVDAPGVTARYVEILITRPGDIGPEVHTIPQVGDISTANFEYTLLESAEHIYPNTAFSARWRVTDTSGTVTLGPTTSITYVDTRFQWQTATGNLVRVHWYKGDQAFGQRALAVGEAGVAKAEALLGVTETDPVDFYVYADIPAFYGALGPGTRENVGGEALPEIRTLFALITPDQIDASWVGVVIPHELTHLVFDTAVHNPYHFPPHWLNEGLAVYLSQGYVASDRALVHDAVDARDLIPLPGLEGQFPTSRDKFSLAYAESVSAVDFMVRTYSRDALVKLIRSYTTGVTDDAAFSAALGVNVAAFSAAWLADNGAARPIPLGPKPDPAGPLPSGWSSSPAAAASSAPVPSGAAPSALAGPSGLPSSSAAPGTTAQPTAATAVPPSYVLPTFGGGASGPAASAGQVPVASPAPAATPGVITDQPIVTHSSNAAIAGLLGLLALVLGAVGVGLLAFRRQSPQPR